MAQTPTAWNQGRPFNLPGMSRDNAPARPVDPGILARASSTVRNWLGMNSAPGARELPFFPPGQPLPPIAPGAVGRQFDYPTNYNANIRARAYEPIDFETLRALAEPGLGGWDLIRLAIETRKDQMSKLEFSILPRKPANVQLRPKSDARCQKVEQFLRRPDGEHSWADWVRMLVEEHLVIDAATIYRRPTLDGDVAKLELLDGSMIKPVLGYDGRRPEGGGPAYVQNLKGLPAVHYTADELIYAPRNPRVHKVYGCSPVEQVLITINIGLRRQVSQLSFYTEGNIPDAVAQVPPEWSIQKIREWQDYWDTIVNDAVNRRKMKFIPGGMQFQPTRNDEALVNQFDEWLARVVQYCFSLPPTPLVRMMNRATSESAYESALDEGLQPLMKWVKDIIDDILVRWFKLDDVEMVWDDIKKTDPAEKETRDLALVQQGVISRDDMRSERGEDPLGIPPIITGIGPLGFMSVKAVIKAIEAGWDLTGMPQPGLGAASGGELAPGTDPALLGSGQEGDPLLGLPPEILEALGVAGPPADALADAADSPDATPQSSAADRTQPGAMAPYANAAGSGSVVPIHMHPGVQAALRAGESHAKQLAARMGAAGR